MKLCIDSIFPELNFESKQTIYVKITPIHRYILSKMIYIYTNEDSFIISKYISDLKIFEGRYE